MPRQESLCLYGRGVYKTRSGHLRYTSPRSVRGKYVHRVIIETLLHETPYSLVLLIPWPYEVHHIDYNKENNVPSNLLILDERLHAAVTADRARDDGGRFGRKFMPKWSAPSEILQPKFDAFEDQDNEVPF